MDEKSKSIWKKSLHLPQLLLVWLGLIMATMVICLFLNITINEPFVISWLTIFGATSATVLLAGWIFIRWLWCWRNLKRTLFALACFATLIALFYAEEDWRGKHDWEKFKREWEAKGERFDFASVIPPPVPDEQNFALKPIVASCYEYILDKSGHKLEKSNTNVVDRLAISREGNAGDWKNWPTNGNWLRQTLTDLRGWQQFYRALAAKTNEFPIPAQPQSPAQDVLLALSKYDSTIEELRTASLLPYSRFPLNYDSENPGVILLPHLAAMKRCSQVLQLRAIAELQNGQSDEAAADVKLGLRLSEAIRTEPIIISHLVRIVMAEIILQPIYEGLANHQWTDTQLVGLNSELAKLDFLADCQRVQKSEIAFNVSEIDYLRRYRDFNGMFDEMGMNRQADQKMKSLIYRIAPSGWFFQSAVQNSQNLMQYCSAVESDALTISPRKTDKAVRAENSASSKGWSFDALNPLKKAFDSDDSDLLSSRNFLEKTASAQASVDLARTAIALARYRLAHGEFPESLDALAPQFIAKVPHDVIGGQPLKYRREADGRFVLYAVGWNETDDGGIMGYRKNRTVPDFELGDWVWQYPAK